MKVGADALLPYKIPISIDCSSLNGRRKSRSTMYFGKEIPAQFSISRSVSMARQHTENLLRGYKGKLVTIRSISGTVYKGQVGEITNDYLLLTDSQTENETKT